MQRESDRRTRSGAGVRAAAGLPAIALIAAGLTADARAEMSVGMRFGWSDVSGEFFTGSGELGTTNLIGAQLGVGFLKILELEVAGEYISEEFTFTEGIIEGVEAAGAGEWEDMALYATGRARILGLVFLPVQVCVGGGLNLHWAELTLDEVSLSPQDAPADEIEKAVEEIAGERSELGWHLVGGLRLAPPSWVVSVIAEGRYQKGFDPDQLPEATSIYLGVSFRL
jgi:hypothetical protein